MAIEYSIEIDSPMTAVELTEWLTTKVGFDRDPDGTDCSVSMPGIYCVVLPQSALGHELKEACFGIQTSLKVMCRIDKFDAFQLGMDQLVILCITLLEELPCDLVLLANFEQGVLLRKGGTINIDCSEKYWEVIWDKAFANSALTPVKRPLPSM